MKHILNLAQLLVSCWVVSGDDRTIPTSQLLLDRALQIATEKGIFPQWAREKLHFVDSRIGLQCVELSTILKLAQTAQLTSAPNPSYQKTVVQISPEVAEYLLQQLEVS